MGLRPGQTNNPKGRPKKSLTKISGELRNGITTFLSENLEDVIKEFKKLDSPSQKIKLYIDLLNFSLPRLKASDQASELGNLTEKELNYIIETIQRNHAEAIKANQN